MEKTNVTTIGSVVTAVIASLCCIGPVAVALIGIGSIGAFAIFEEYRPYLIALTALLLGLAFFLTYRKREIICEDGSCRIESAGRWNKISIWIASGFVLLALAFPYFDLTSSSRAHAMVTELSSQVVVLDIDGMDCQGCAKGLEATLGRVKGVKEAAVQFEQGTAVITYDPAKVHPDELTASVDETGFKATIASSQGNREEKEK